MGGGVGWGGMITSMFLCAHRHGNLITRELAVGLCPFLSLFPLHLLQSSLREPLTTVSSAMLPKPFRLGSMPCSSISEKTSSALQGRDQKELHTYWTNIKTIIVVYYHLDTWHVFGCEWSSRIPFQSFSSYSSLWLCCTLLHTYSIHFYTSKPFLKPRPMDITDPKSPTFLASAASASRLLQIASVCTSFDASVVKESFERPRRHWAQLWTMWISNG